MVGEMPVERSAQLIFLILTWTGGVGSGYGSTADQGRTGREVSSSRLWRPARALGTHAKQGPSTGHSAVGLRQAGKCLLTPRPHFTAHHARLVTRWFVLRTALLFVRSAVRLVYAELPRPVAVGSPKQAHGELGYQTDYADRLGRRVWITNRSNRNRSNSSQLWIWASLWARRVNTWFDCERSNNVRVRDNGEIEQRARATQRPHPRRRDWCATR
jgi:hypothetical protein